MGNYKFMIGQDCRFRLVDTRDNVDYSQFIAGTSSSYKAILTASDRNRSGPDRSLEEGAFMLTYPRGKVEIVNVSKGDYVPPGYERVSINIAHAIEGWSGIKAVRRSVLTPPPGQYIINPLMVTRFTGSFRVSSTEINKVLGWTIANSDTSVSLRMRSDSNGIHAYEGVGVMYQNIHVEGVTSIELVCRDVTNVFINSDPMESMGEGVWRWSGDPLGEDTTLSVVIQGADCKGVERFDVQL